MRLLIIIPAYNEAENIHMVVGELRNVCPHHDYLIVNDGSKDNTSEICRQNGFAFLDLPINLGLAGAVQAGMQYASREGYDAVLQFDGDGQHEAGYIDALLDEMKTGKSEIVIGSRFLCKKKPKNLRMAGNSLLKLLIRMVTGVKLTDPTSGMRMFNKRMIEEFAWNLNYGPEPDTLVYLIRSGVKVTEVQVEMRERVRGESYLSFANSIRYMLHMIVSILFVHWFREGVKRRDGVR